MLGYCFSNGLEKFAKHLTKTHPNLNQVFPYLSFMAVFLTKRFLVRVFLNYVFTRQKRYCLTLQEMGTVDCRILSNPFAMVKYKAKVTHPG